jgi:methylisocitrate lyase
MIQPPLASSGARLRALWSKGPAVLPGAFSPFSARLAWRAGASAVYLSGGAMTNEHLGVPDIGLMSLDEMAGIAARTCQAVPVPVVCDADTGFGGEWNVRRTVIEMERAGLAGIHIEDQAMPKRCGHLAGKELVAPEEMAGKIARAAEAKRDESFVIIARTDARGVSGFSDAVERARLYLRAGADAIFPEGLVDEEEFAAFRSEVPDAPLLANMTEFGRTPLITAGRFGELGYQMVIFPVTALRVMMRRLEEFYSGLLESGTQAGWMDRMSTRAELYEAVGYPAYEGENPAPKL